MEEGSGWVIIETMLKESQRMEKLSKVDCECGAFCCQAGGEAGRWLQRVYEDGRLGSVYFTKTLVERCSFFGKEGNRRAMADGEGKQAG